MKRRHLLRGSGLLLALALFGAAAWSDDKTTNDRTGDERVSLNFANADIDSVIKAVGKITGRNFLVDPRVKGNLNIVTNSPIPRDLAYQTLVSALRLQGYAAVDGQGVTKIVPEADAKLQGVPVNPDRKLRGDRLVTQVFALRQESAAQMLPVIRPLVSPNNSVTAFAANNSLVVTDYAENVERIRRIVESIDVPQGDVVAIELRHAVAQDTAAAITRLLQAVPGQGGDAAQRVQIVAEPRTNTLLVRADNPTRIAAVRQIVASLDRPGAGGNIHVVYLRNADATRVARTLNAVIAKDGSGLASSAGFAAPLAANDGMAGNAAATPAANAAAAGFGGSANATASGGIVQANPDSNALIITASEAVYRNLRRVIDELDRRRAQVYIEALIAEISTERAAEFGIQWVGGGGTGSTGVVGGTSFSSGGNNLLQLATSIASGSTATLPGNGLNLAISGGKVNVPGIGEMVNLGLLARFLETETKANILSTPNIVTLDNEEAKIVVGSNLPFVTGQYTNTGSGTTPTNPFQTIERRDVGLTLRVKPQISEGGAIRLAIYQEASAVVASSTANTAGPTTSKRAIESMVMVDNGAVIALGGLMEDSYSGGQEKVPVLGDLPVVGGLFRYDSRKRSKTNLVVFLRPLILRDQADYADLARSRYDYVIGQQTNLAGERELMRNEAPPPRLPATAGMSTELGEQPGQ